MTAVSIRSRTLALTAAVLGFAAPAMASAAERPAGAPPAPIASPTPQAETRYCVADIVTGSRIAKKVCHTRKEWLNQGFDPLAK